MPRLSKNQLFMIKICTRKMLCPGIKCLANISYKILSKSFWVTHIIAIFTEIRAYNVLI